MLSDSPVGWWCWCWSWFCSCCWAWLSSGGSGRCAALSWVGVFSFITLLCWHASNFHISLIWTILRLVFSREVSMNCEPVLYHINFDVWKTKPDLHQNISVIQMFQRKHCDVVKLSSFGFLTKIFFISGHQGPSSSCPSPSHPYACKQAEIYHAQWWQITP